MLGRLPWLALLRRVRAFFFLVFFDMNYQPTLYEVPAPRQYGERCRPRKTTTESAPTPHASSAGAEPDLARRSDPCPTLTTRRPRPRPSGSSTPSAIT